MLSVGWLAACKHAIINVVSNTRTATPDFWTTKCTRCPAALDKLQTMTKEHSNITFVSICCDKLDGAREIIEQEDELRWQGLEHYFMANEQKEEAKRILGFNSVPFYVFVNKRGEITQMGGASKINFRLMPGVRVQEEDKENVNNNKDTTKMEEPAVTKTVVVEEPQERVFEIDDMDF